MNKFNDTPEAKNNDGLAVPTTQKVPGVINIKIASFSDMTIPELKEVEVIDEKTEPEVLIPEKEVQQIFKKEMITPNHRYDKVNSEHIPHVMSTSPRRNPISEIDMQSGEIQTTPSNIQRPARTIFTPPPPVREEQKIETGKQMSSSHRWPRPTWKNYHQETIEEAKAALQRQE